MNRSATISRKLSYNLTKDHTVINLTPVDILIKNKQHIFQIVLIKLFIYDLNDEKVGTRENNIIAQ